MNELKYKHDMSDVIKVRDLTNSGSSMIEAMNAVGFSDSSVFYLLLKRLNLKKEINYVDNLNFL